MPDELYVTDVIGPAPNLVVGGVSYYAHWTCPKGCGYRFMTNDPYDAGDVGLKAAEHTC